MYRFVYLTTNNVNGKKYIGKHETEDIMDGYIGSGTLLMRAIAKYGLDEFTREILYFADTSEEVSKAEIRIIEENNAVASREFYNLAPGGMGGNTSAHLTKEQRSDKCRQKWANMSDEAKKQMGAKISKAHSGKKKSEEHRKKMSETRKGVPRWSKETREKYSIKRKQEVLEGIRVPPKGNAGNKDFRHTEETKKTLSESQKKRHAEANGHLMTDAGKERRKNKLQNEYWTEDRRVERAEKTRRNNLSRAAKNNRWQNIEEMLKTMTHSEIGAELSVSPSAVSQYIRKHNIKVEKSDEYYDKVQQLREKAAKIAHSTNKAANKKWDGVDLYDLYVTQGKTQQEIADIIGVYPSQVSTKLKELGIKRQ